jgi:hypothetical protein
MTKTAEFGEPAAAVQKPGQCRICHKPTSEWADDVHTVCKDPECIAEARREIGR